MFGAKKRRLRLRQAHAEGIRQAMADGRLCAVVIAPSVLLQRGLCTQSKGHQGPHLDNREWTPEFIAYGFR
jgi:hypothetical protein